MDENDSCTHLLFRLISFQMTVAKKLACESQWVKWKMWKQSWDFPTFKNSQSHVAVLWHLETLPTVPAMSVGDACRHLAENGAAQMVQYRSSMFVLGLPKTICFVKVTVWAWAEFHWYFLFWVNLADLVAPQYIPHEQFEKQNSRLISFQIAVAKNLACESQWARGSRVETSPHSKFTKWRLCGTYAHCQLSQQCPSKRELWCPYKMVQRKWYNTDLPCLSSFCPRLFVLLELKGHTFARDVPYTLWIAWS